MPRAASEGLILGLDVGANSIGWALVEPSSHNIVRTGARAFDEGVEGDIESGKDESRAKARREARMRRRMLSRRARRLKKLSLILQGAGLLPAGDMSTEEARHNFFTNLDRDLFPGDRTSPDAHVLCYRLRARALDETLAPHEIGRALYHLAQRRGFLSNRKAARKDTEKEEGEVKKAIAQLAADMQAAGADTLGQFFSRLDPEQQRIRARWTSRQMFLDEFEKIWTVQAAHHPTILAADLKKKVHRAIFFQRPLKWKRSTIADCELEKDRKCAPVALLIAQRFRFLQKVNDLEFVNTADGVVGKLTPEQRQALVAKLETQAEISFSKIRTLLKLPKTCRFNFEKEDGDDRLIGNRTAARLIKTLGEQRWAALSLEDRDRIVEDVRSIQKEEAQERRGVKAWGLQGDAATEFGRLAFEPGYCRLSRKALAKIVPRLEQGVQYATARKELYGGQPAPQPLDALPPIESAPIPEIRNPAVQRALTELRKVVNAVIRQYGKPAQVRVELARDLKKTRDDRKDIWKKNQENRKARERAAAAIVAEFPAYQPRRSDTEKYLLAEECQWHCPYTGKTMTMASLFGPSPQFDVEHIIPFSRCLDNSFMNKTLCEISENRNRKLNRTPWEAYGADAKRWDEIMQRVGAFAGNARRAKLQRFQLKDLESLDDFAARQLNDTRYATRLAVRYLGLLYGCNLMGVAPDGRRPIQAGRGQVTGFLRDELGLNEILGDGGQKTREDHRHHAVDALAIALTDAKTVKMLSDAAARALRERRRRFGRVEPPWPSFLDDARRAIGQTIVSHRVSRKVNGPLHDQTLYSKPQKDADGQDCVHVRKRLDKGFTAAMVADIVDPVVRQRVEAHLKAHDNDPKKAFALPENHPVLETKDGRKIPIHKARIRIRQTTMPIGSGRREGRIMSGSNHHIEIFEVKDSKGRIKWDGKLVSRYEAMQRLRNRQPIVHRDHGPDKKWVFSLAGGESVQMKDPESGTPGLFVVTGISEGEITMLRNADARPSKVLRKTRGARVRPAPDTLRKLGAKKVTITPDGEVRRAND